MSDKQDQSHSTPKKPLRNRKAIRVPISLHFYLAEIIVFILFAFFINLFIQYSFEKFIDTECNTRLNLALESTNNLFEVFNKELSSSEDNSNPINYAGYSDDENFRFKLVNTLASSADLSNQANIALYYLNNETTGEYTLLWPTVFNSRADSNNANIVISHVIEEKSYTDLQRNVRTFEQDGRIIYYMSSYIGDDENNLYDNYYFCFYIDSYSYYEFMDNLKLALINATLLGLLFAGLLIIFLTYPIIFSSQKLSKFARRIAKGNFKPVKGYLVSRELAELGDVMNQMAYKLEESDIEQKTFFQNASHELRTPLMSIQGYAEGLKCGVFESDEDKEGAIDVIIDETGRLSYLVENLLSISKMDMSRSGNYEVKKQIIDASKICDSVIDRVRGNFIHDDKAIINDIKLDSTYIYANENDIFRCLENIFSNCLRYCNEAVTFRCRRDQSGDNVVFEISDDGPGIAPDVIETIFERFSKGTDGRHGIGMALAKSIAEEHGGAILAFNKPEGGACFRVSIPVTHQQDQLTNINKSSTK